ncbi:MAG TPA: type II toxin-antitoxin system RelE/ParE family toxin [Promineifilum sp.]|nr:type II toxin-antitoxin system RelE/ParE family toxin [Promineifilum sp.]
MQFIETPIFTRHIMELLSDEEYSRLQEVLLMRPEAGDLIPGGGGLRKLRWRVSGTGKRGGLRTIYYWDVSSEVCYMLFVYKKSAKSDLTQQQLRILRNLVKEYLQ